MQYLLIRPPHLPSAHGYSQNSIDNRQNPLPYRQRKSNPSNPHNSLHHQSKCSLSDILTKHIPD